MADTKTSALTSATALTGTEQLPGVQSAASVKITGTQLADLSRSGLHPGYRSGYYYAQHQNREDQANGVSNNTIYIYPFHIRQAVSVTALTLLNNSSVGGSLARAGLYTMGNLSSGVAGTKLAETSTTFDLSGAVARIDRSFASPLVFAAPTWCWMAIAFSGAALSMYGFSTNDACMESILGGVTSTEVFGSDSFIKGFSAPFTFAALPADFTALTLSEVVGGMPKALIKIT